MKSLSHLHHFAATGSCLQARFLFIVCSSLCLSCGIALAEAQALQGSGPGGGREPASSTLAFASREPDIRRGLPSYSYLSRKAPHALRSQAQATSAKAAAERGSKMVMAGDMASRCVSILYQPVPTAMCRLG